jgi:hypothetical protein
LVNLLITIKETSNLLISSELSFSDDVTEIMKNLQGQAKPEAFVLRHRKRFVAKGKWLI